MKYTTPHLIGFALTTIILSSAFFYYLFTNLVDENYSYIHYVALGFGALMFISGLSWGNKDSARKSRHDLGFLYHFYTFIFVNVVNFVFILLYPELREFMLDIFLISLGFWAIGILLHYYQSRKHIKGMSKEDLFV